MTEEVTDFWPENLSLGDDPEPVKLLKEQAQLLGKRTGQQVQGTVRQWVIEETVYYSLYLKPAQLVDYLFNVLSIAHPISRATSDPFPLTAQTTFGGEVVELDDMNAFKDWLKLVLSSDRVKAVIENLIRQNPIAS